MLKRLFCTAAVAVAMVTLVAWMAPGGSEVLVDPPLVSIGVLEAGGNGVLFAGDSQAGVVYALEMSGVGPSSGEFTSVSDLDGKIAAMLGTSPRDIYIKDMAADSAAGVAYLSVMRGRGEAAQPVLIRVTAAGAVEHVDFAGLQYTRLDLRDAPEADPNSRRDPRSYTVTDMELIGDDLYIAGLSNEEFSSVLRRSAYPFTGEATATGLEIYHGAHGQYETHSPIFTFTPFELDGEAHVLAGYLCTPLVAFSLDELRNSDKVRGKTIAELGFGNVPLDMVTFEQKGHSYLLLTNSRRGTMKISFDDIRAAYERDAIVEPVGPRTGVDYIGSPLGHVVHVDDYGDSVLVLSRNPENGSLSLAARGKDRL